MEIEQGQKFFEKYYYSSLELAFGDLFPVKEVWDSWAPPKVGFALAWEAFWAKIMTLDQLRRRDRTIAT